LTHSAQHYAPNDTPDTLRCQLPVGVSFSASSVPEWSRPFATLRREASFPPLRLSKALPHSIPQPPQPAVPYYPPAERCPHQSQKPLTKQATFDTLLVLMNKTSFIKRVSQQHKKPQITQLVYNKVLKDLLTGIQQELAAGRKVSFLGFGTFYTRIHRGGKGFNFKTNKPVAFKAVRIPAFRPGSLLRKAARRKK